MESLLHSFLYTFSYPTVYLLTVGFFLLLYFLSGFVIQKTHNWGLKKGWIEKIVLTPIKPKQVHSEIKNSIRSIFVFGITTLPIVFLYRVGFVAYQPSTVAWTALSLVVLNVYNEIHFYLLHRMFHLPFFMKHIHYVHHQSRVPTVWSVFSFHWFEGLLLSFVPLVVILFFPLAPIVYILYPINSILINLLGHANVRIKGLENSPWGFVSKHSTHHLIGKNNYGFASTLLDKWARTQQKSTKQ